MPSLGSSPLFCLLALLPAPDGLASEPPVTALAFAPDGRSVLAGSQAGLVVRSWPDLKPVRNLLDDALAHSRPSRSHLVATSLPRGSGRRPSRVRSTSSLARREPGSTTTRRTSNVVVCTRLEGSTAVPGPQRFSIGPCRCMPPAEKPSGSSKGTRRGVVGICYLPDGRSLDQRGHRPEPPGLGGGVRSSRARLEPRAGPGPRPPPVATRRRSADGRLDWHRPDGPPLATHHLPDGSPVEAGIPPFAVTWTHSGVLDRRGLRRQPRATDRPRYGRDPRDNHALDGRAHSLTSAPDGAAWWSAARPGVPSASNSNSTPRPHRDRERTRARPRPLDEIEASGDRRRPLAALVSMPLAHSRTRRARLPPRLRSPEAGLILIASVN